MCGIVVTVEDERVTRVRGDDRHPLSQGYTCPKGRALPAFHHDLRRLDHPMVRDRAHGPTRTVSWDEVLDDLAARVQSVVDEVGPDGVGAYFASGSAFDTNGRRIGERFLRVLGSRQKYTATTVDTPSKPLVAELVGGWSGLTPMWDHAASSLLVLFGTNPVVSHGHSNAMPDPVSRLRDFRSRGGRVWVIDPLRTETARLADRHLAIRAGTDHAVLAFLVRELLRDGADHHELERHATGVAELAAAVEPFDVGHAAELSGLSPDELTDLLADVRSAGRVSALTGTGVSMAADANVAEWLLWALGVVTGSYDRRGGMWFNPGYLFQFDTRDWTPSDGTPEPGPASRPELPRRMGEYPCAALADEIEAGNLRALFVVGANPVISLPDRARLTAALERLEVCAVIDVIDTDTTGFATHLLPAAGQLERADVPWLLDAYQLEVATQYTPAVVAPGAERRPVWQMFAALGDRMGIDVLPGGLTTDECDDDALIAQVAGRSRGGAEAVFAARTGVVHEGPVYGWVHDRVLPEGRWRLAPPPLVQQLANLGEPPALQLTPRRQLRKMNSQLRDVHAPGGRTDVVDVAVHPDDAAAAGVADGAPVTVTSAHGSLVGTARVTDTVRRGTVSIPHGWADPNVCSLTSDTRHVDPLTGMVRQCGVEVRLEQGPSRPAAPGA